MRATRVHRSLHRQALVLGAERELVMYAALIALLVAAGGMTVLSCAVGVAFWSLCLFALRRMAAVDPCMSKVWLRHIKQQPVYLARSKPWMVQ